MSMISELVFTEGDSELMIKVDGNSVVFSIISGDEEEPKEFWTNDNNAIDIARTILTGCSYNGRE
jgi:hypothetical protein